MVIFPQSMKSTNHKNKCGCRVIGAMNLTGIYSYTAPGWSHGAMAYYFPVLCLVYVVLSFAKYNFPNPHFKLKKKEIKNIL